MLPLGTAQNPPEQNVCKGDSLWCCFLSDIRTCHLQKVLDQGVEMPDCFKVTLTQHLGVPNGEKDCLTCRALSNLSSVIKQEWRKMEINRFGDVVLTLLKAFVDGSVEI